MTKLISSFLLVLAILTGCSRNSPLIIKVADFGLKPGTGENAIPAVIKALNECKKHPGSVLLFDKGRYDFNIDSTHTRIYFESNTTNDTPKNLAILIEGCSGLTLDGGNSEFVFHGAIQPITVDHSDGITIQNVTIDWDIPLTAQAKIVATSSKNIDFEIDTLQFPYVITDGKLFFTGENWKERPNGFMEYEANTHRIAAGTGDNGCIRGEWDKSITQELKPGTVRMNGYFTRTPAVGNYLILRHSKRDHAGIFIQESSNVMLENVTIYHTAGLGILTQFTRNLSYKNVKVIPNSAKNRYLSGHDDGFHISNCAGSISIADCEFGGLMDDPINVHGTSVRIIEKINDRQLKCRFMHEQSTGMNWGHLNDTIGFIEHKSMQTVSRKSLKRFEKLTNEEFLVEFNDPVPVDIVVGDALENLSWSPEVTIQNCKFGSCRARGLLISTPRKVLITNNYFDSSGSAILIAGDANGWYESGAVSDVTITNNVFKDGCMTSMYQFCEGIISIFPIIPEINRAKPFHRNIRIEDNTFYPYDYPVLYALSVDGLRFKHNRIIRSHAFEPFHSRKDLLTFESCLNVEVNGNQFEGDALSKMIRLEKMDRSQLKSDLGVRE